MLLNVQFAFIGNSESVKRFPCRYQFTGKAVYQGGGGWIAVVHRYDDKEEKWVVAPETQTFSMDDIKKEIHFQEQYFDSEVIMLDT